MVMLIPILNSRTKTKGLPVYKKLTCPICKQEAYFNFFKQQSSGFIFVIPFWGSIGKAYLGKCGNCQQISPIKKEYGEALEASKPIESVTNPFNQENPFNGELEPETQINVQTIYSEKGQTKLENISDVGGSSQDSQWLTNFELIRRQTDSSLNRVKAASTGTEEELSDALNEALEKLPVLLQMMKETPIPSKKEYQKYKKDVLMGMELFIKGCQDNIEWIKTRQDRSLTDCSSNISMAYSKFNKANIWLAKGSE